MSLCVFLVILCVDYIFGSNLGPRGSGSGLKRRGASVGSILAKFGLKRSHGDPFRDPNCGFGIDCGVGFCILLDYSLCYLNLLYFSLFYCFYLI